MKKRILMLWLLLASFLTTSLSAAPLKSEEESQKKMARCLVITNTGHFEILTPDPLRDLVEKYGGVEYDCIYKMDQLSLEKLQEYDVVWVFNFVAWDAIGKEGDAKFMSNLIGDYVEQGGFLLTTLFSDLTNIQTKLGMGEGKYFNNNVSPFLPTPTLSNISQNIGEIVEPNHPIMKNVKVINTGVTYATEARKDAKVLAYWSDGSAPVAAIKGNVVGVNFAPVNIVNPLQGPGSYVYGDGHRLISNAIRWLFEQKYNIAAPNAITDLKVLPNMTDGGTKPLINFQWKNPTHAMNGEPLAKIDSIVILRDNKRLVAIKTGLTTGGAMTYDDNTVAEGEHTYKIFAYTAGLKGYETKTKIYAGKDVPGAVANLSLSPEGNAGRIKWSAPLASKKGGWYDKTDLKYDIYRVSDGKIIAQNISETTYLDESITKKDKYSYRVTPSNKDGMGVSSITAPMTLFTNGDIYMGTSDITVCDAKFYDPSGPNAKYKGEGKEYFLTLRPKNPEAGQRISLDFNLFSMNGSIGTENVIVFDGPEPDEKKAFFGSPFYSPKLTPLLKNFTASPTNTSGALTIYFYDGGDDAAYAEGWDADISCITLEDYDLLAKELIGEKMPIINKVYTYKAKIKNNGLKSIDSYTVKMFEGSKSNVIATSNVTKSLASGATQEVELTYAFTALGKKNIGFFIESSQDTKSDNNTSLPYEVSVQTQKTIHQLVSNGGIKTIFGPINFFRKMSVTQTIYYPRELSVDGGNITGLRYYNSFGSEVSDEVVKIYISETKDVDLAYGWRNPASMKKVFEHAVHFPKGENVITLIFDSVYKYKGGNLVLHVEHPVSSVSYSLGEAFAIFWDEENNFRQLAYAGDDTWNMTSEYRNNNYGPQVNFVIDCKEYASIEGRITSNEGDTLENVKISIKGKTFDFYSDEDGNFKIPSLAAGSYELTYDIVQHEIKKETIVVTAGQTLTHNVVLKALPKFNVSGTIIDNAGDLVPGATVALSGYADFSAQTDAEGKYILENVFAEQMYDLKVSKDLFTGVSISFNMGSKDTTLKNLSITQIALPAIGVTVKAEDDATVAEVNWTDPADMTYRRLVHDDGTAETNYGLVVGKEGWFGSLFKREDTGYIQSIDVYGYQHPYMAEGEPSSRPLTLDIFNSNREVIYSSEPFYMPAGEWISIDLPFVKYSGTFYAMVHFPATPEEQMSHQIGADENGPNAGAETNYYYDGYFWGVVQSATMNLNPFAFLIRTNILTKEETEAAPFIAQSPDYSRAKYEDVSKLGQSFESSVLAGESKETMIHPFGVIAKAPSSKAFSPKAFPAKFDVYTFGIKDEANSSSWTKLGSTEKSTFSDDKWGGLAQGIYKYAVKANYGDKLSSSFGLSNNVLKNMFTKISFKVKSNTTAITSEGAEVRLISTDEGRNDVYTAKVDANGDVLLEDVYKGKYKLKVTKLGFADYATEGLVFDKEKEYKLDEITLKEDLRAAYNLEIIPEETKGEYKLTWNTSINIEDGFESHPDFALNSPGKIGWEYLELDDIEYCYFIDQAEYPNLGLRSAYQVFNPSMTKPPMETIEIFPYRGKKLLTSFSSPEDASDKWIISPELNYTHPFVFKFYAKAFDVLNGLETFQVGYSTTGTDPEDFTWVQFGSYEVVGANIWQEFSYNIPGQAKRVTIRCTSNDKYIFMLDEIFIGNEQEGTSTIKEFEIYLDDKLVTTTTDKSYTFTGIENPREHKAGVKAVYASGKAKTVYINFITSLEGDLDAALSMYPNPATDQISLQSSVLVKQVEIYNIYGSLLRTQVIDANSAELSIKELSQGNYILRIYTPQGVAVKRFVKQ